MDCIASRTISVGVMSAMVVATLIGCSDGRPDRVPVSGQVLIDGKPLKYGFIRFIAKDARPSTSQIGKDGRFQMTCFSDCDGAVLGTHRVIINGAEPIGPNSQRWHAPKQYASPSTSGLTATIDGPTDSLLFELSWGGKQPFVEMFTIGE